MKLNPNIHHRRSIRLKGFDYSNAGYYFITICTKNCLQLFGEIRNNQMIMNDAGKMVQKWWDFLESKYNNIELHQKIVMPNHFHGIIQITPVGADQCVRPHVQGGHIQGGHIGPPLHAMVQWFKTMSTNDYIRNVKQNDWPRFENKLWQRDYYEHIIRNDNALCQISNYIQMNPTKWGDDRFSTTRNGRIP